MSDPKEDRDTKSERDQLALEHETLGDLDLSEQEGHDVRGGPCWNSYGGHNPPVVN